MGIADRLIVDAEPWRPADDPNHPNPLEGNVLDVDTGDGDFGPYPIIFIRDTAGNNWRWHVFGGVAQGKVAKLRPEPGNEIAVQYIGEKPSRNYQGKTYKDWAVVVGKADGQPAIDWDSMAKNAEEDEEF